MWAYLLIFATILIKLKSAISAISEFSAETSSSVIFCIIFCESLSLSFQTSKNASPIFLFACPPYFLTELCVISAI